MCGIMCQILSFWNVFLKQNFFKYTRIWWVLALFYEQGTFPRLGIVPVPISIINNNNFKRGTFPSCEDSPPILERFLEGIAYASRLG